MCELGSTPSFSNVLKMLSFAQQFQITGTEKISEDLATYIRYLLLLKLFTCRCVVRGSSSSSSSSFYGAYYGVPDVSK